MVDLGQVRACLNAVGIFGDALEAIMALVALHAQPDRAVTVRPDDLPRKQPRDLGDVAAEFLRSSLRRKDLIGRAADDPAWNMLLALFSDHRKGIRTSVSSACFASGAASTTALRHIAFLQDQGLISRNADVTDRRRSHLELTPEAADRMAELIESFCVERVGRQEQRGRLTD
jgi:hypothetical protein